MMTGRLSLVDPDGSGVLAGAADWVRALVTGTPATIVATLAVAAVGLLMLQGRLPLRRGLTVALGFFVIFGAGAIADALLHLRDDSASVDVVAQAPPSAPAPVSVPAQPCPFGNFKCGIDPGRRC